MGGGGEGLCKASAVNEEWHSGVHVVCPLAHTIPVCRGMKLPSVNSEETSTR